MLDRQTAHIQLSLPFSSFFLTVCPSQSPVCIDLSVLLYHYSVVVHSRMFTQLVFVACLVKRYTVWNVSELQLSRNTMQDTQAQVNEDEVK